MFWRIKLLFTGSFFNSTHVHRPVLQTLNVLSSQFHACSRLHCKNEMSANDEESSNGEDDDLLPGGGRVKVIEVDPETSIRYMKSKAYQLTYKDLPVWVPYRRNFPGQFLPKHTKRSCIRKGVLFGGNPCPICRDEYLVIHYSNVELLRQFINPNTGELIDINKVQVCQRQYKQLQIAVHQAHDKGLLQMRLPFRKYDYSEYYPQMVQNKQR